MVLMKMGHLYQDDNDVYSEKIIQNKYHFDLISIILLNNRLKMRSVDIEDPKKKKTMMMRMT